MILREQSTYEFGHFRVDCARRLLLRDGEVVPLTPKCFEILLMLVENSGEVVDKEGLMNRVWPDSFVEEGNLTYNISVLRKVLGDRANEHLFIITVPGRGYQFVASVCRRVYRESADGATQEPSLKEAVEKGEGAREADKTIALVTKVSSSHPTSSAEYIVNAIKHHKLATFAALVVMIAAAAGAGLSLLRAKSSDTAIDSVVVLPFTNQNGDQDTEYLSDGLTESIINNLTRLADLRVIARTSAFRYKGKEDDPFGTAKELGVSAVVVGRVLQRGESLTVGVELVDARETKQLWGQQYNRKLTDVFAVQEEIAREISEKLRLKLTGAEKQQLKKRPTESLKAFQYYMLGRSYIQRGTREGVLAAIHHCEKAIEEDPNYALAYAALAEAYANLGIRGYIAPIEGRRRSEETARKALALDENLAEAHAALGYAYTVFAPSNFSLGDRELRHAIELSPALALAHRHLGVSLTRQGRLDEGLEEILKARELDPLSSIIARLAAVPYYLKRDYSRAVELVRQANELGPALSVHFEIGMYIQNKSFKEALAELEKAKRERKSDPILIYGRGMVYAAQHTRAEALKIIKELEDMSGAGLDEAHWIAKIYAALNEKEKAFLWLENGLATGAIGAFYKDEPVWDTIRSDSRFADLVRRMESAP